MKELKEKIILLRYLKGLFYLFFIVGGMMFVSFTIFQDEFYIRNAAISLVIMIFDYAFAQVCNSKTDSFFSEYKRLKTKKVTNKCNVIEFDKIA